MESKKDVIRLVINIPGVGKQAHEYSYCIIGYRSRDNDNCPIGGGKCRYGLTEISPLG